MVAAILFSSDTRLQPFLAPGYDVTVTALRATLGIRCNTDQYVHYTVPEGQFSASRATFTPTLNYPGHDITFRVQLEVVGNEWRVRAVEPIP
jgi:hypothetical protein